MCGPPLLWHSYDSTHRAKTGPDVLPPDKTTQGLILLFPIDTAKGSIMGLLRATCIMPNSSGVLSLCSLFSSLLILVIQSSSSSRGGKNPHLVPHVWPGTSIHWWPFTRSGRRWGSGDEDRRAEERKGRRPVWLSPNGASCGYPSNTDYYVVPPLTLMGCYNDLKWFNGSQVGAPNGPLYTPMRIMNGNDSVVKCLCFFGFPSPSFVAAAQAVWQVSFCVVIGLQTLQRLRGRLADSV